MDGCLTWTPCLAAEARGRSNGLQSGPCDRGLELPSEACQRKLHSSLKLQTPDLGVILTISWSGNFSCWTIGLKIQLLCVVITRGIDPVPVFARTARRGPYRTAPSISVSMRRQGRCPAEMPVSGNLLCVKAVYHRLQVDHHDAGVHVPNETTLLRLFHEGFDNKPEHLGLATALHHPPEDVQEAGL